MASKSKKLSAKFKQDVRTGSNTSVLSPIQNIYASKGIDSKVTQSSKLDKAAAQYMWRKDAKTQKYIENKGKLRKA